MSKSKTLLPLYPKGQVLANGALSQLKQSLWQVVNKSSAERTTKLCARPRSRPDSAMASSSAHTCFCFYASGEDIQAGLYSPKNSLILTLSAGTTPFDAFRCVLDQQVALASQKMMTEIDGNWWNYCEGKLHRPFVQWTTQERLEHGLVSSNPPKLSKWTQPRFCHSLLQRTGTYPSR